MCGRLLRAALSMMVALGSSLATANPVADANGPYDVNEGSVVTLDGSGSYATTGTLIQYEWDLDNDGEYDDASGMTVSYSYPDGPLVWTVSLRVTDDAGATDTSSSQVSVLNVAPAIDPIANFYIQSGTNIDLLVSFDDPGGTFDAPYAYVFDWGDGSPTATGSVASVTTLSESHAYVGSLGTVFTGRVTVTDKDGGVGGALFYTEIVESVPAPATLALLGIGLAGLAATRRRIRCEQRIVTTRS